MPASVLQNVLAVVALPAAGQVTLNHLLENLGVGIPPNKILPDRSTPIAVIAVTDTQVTFRNLGPAPETSNFLVQFDHTIQQAAWGPPMNLFWQGGAVVATSGQRFVRVIAQPADGSDFLVTLPVAQPDDSYIVLCSLVSVVRMFSVDFPDTLVGDRTVFQFRCITSTAPANGDVLEFLVMDRT